MDFVVFYYIEFTGVHRDSLWTQHGLCSIVLVESLLDSLWTPCGLHRDFVIFYDTEFTGVSVDSMWTPQRLCSIL